MVSRMVWRDAGGVGEVRMSACALRSRARVSRECWSSSWRRWRWAELSLREVVLSLGVAIAAVELVE
jgi:hypothetical protein